MSTQPPTTTTPTSQQTGRARTTETSPTETPPTETPGTETTPSRFRGGRDRWRAGDDPETASAATQAPLTFDPWCRHRLPNRIDDENQAMLRDRTRDADETA